MDRKAEALRDVNSLKSHFDGEIKRGLFFYIYSCLKLLFSCLKLLLFPFGFKVSEVATHFALNMRGNKNTCKLGCHQHNCGCKMV